MGRGYLLLLLLIGLAMRCSHTSSVEHEGETAASEQKSERRSTAKEGGREVGGHQQHAKRGDTDHGAQDKAAAPSLPTSPAGLLQPGAITAVQDKLVGRGYLDSSDRSEKLDGRTEKALRNFQRDQGLPATGAPDDLTVQKLGLSPRDVFRGAPPEGQ
jgi:hypothetical protein